MMEVNVASMFLTCRAVVPVMREQGGGKIVNISSGTPFRGVPFLLHYVTSKGAIVALTRALAKELGKDSIHVNCVAPGFTMSDGVKSHPEVDREAARRLRRVADDPARPGARGRRRRGRLPLHAGSRLHHRPDDGHRRRPVLPLILVLSASIPDGVETGGRAPRRLRPRARRGALRRGDDGPARVVWELDGEPEPGDWSLRCDRVDFPPGGSRTGTCTPGRDPPDPPRRADDRPRRRRAAHVPRGRVLVRGRRRSRARDRSRRPRTRRSSECCSSRPSGPGAGRSATSTRPTRTSRDSSARRSSSRCLL